jgi:Cyclin, N-terminal domain
MDCSPSSLLAALEMDQARDELAVLLQQECTTYRCPFDYMEHERTDPTAMLVLECANLVTDRAALPPSSPSPQPAAAPSSYPMNKVGSVSSISDVKDVELEQHHQPPHHGHQASTAACYDQTYTFWRQQMFDWACMVVDSFGIDREAVAVSFNLLDRYVAYELHRPGAPTVTRDDYQLFCMTCLYIALKILETYPRKLSVQALVDMSKHYYSRAVIENTERDILNALNWQLHPPTALRYTRLLTPFLMQALRNASGSSNGSGARAPVSFHMKATIETLTEIAVSDSFFVTSRPSTVGLAAILHAARLEGSIPEHKLQRMVRTIQDDVLRTPQDPEFHSIYLQLEKLFCN